MSKTLRSRLIVILACAVLGSTIAMAQGSETLAPIVSLGQASECSNWTLDGYRLGMEAEEILAVRSVTVHMRGQAQVIVPGKLSGVLSLDPMRGLQKWEVSYLHADADVIRAAVQERFGEPTSDVTGNIIDDDSDTVRQRRTIWWGTDCDAAIIVYENTSVRGAPGHTVSATLARASILKQGLADMKTLFD